MNASSLTSIATALIGVAMVTTIVAHKESANAIKAIGSSFANVLLAAQGTK